MHSLQLVIVNKLFLLVWSVSRYVVGKGGQYMVSREGDVVGNNLRVVSMWLVQYVVGIWWYVVGKADQLVYYYRLQYQNVLNVLGFHFRYH